MIGAREVIAMVLTFAVSVTVLILFDYGAVSALAGAIDFFRGLFG